MTPGQRPIVALQRAIRAAQILHGLHEPWEISMRAVDNGWVVAFPGQHPNGDNEDLEMCFELDLDVADDVE